MIKVIVELHPHGDETQKKIIADASITKISLANERDKYSAIINDNEGTHRLVVTGYKRFQSSIWKLIYLALKRIYK